ncbi:MAG: hypothetical protein ACK5RG_09755 [Cyclobacteriaceae bacterium]|jgi:hypothetical protein|nr:hypothetical protein [Flammeovirgaceae bacterium]
MRKIFLISAFIISSQVVLGQQFAFELWHEGKLVLETSDTLRGLVKYDQQSDIIQIKIKGQLQSYTARKVLFVEIFDAGAKRYRQFYSLPFSANNTYKTPIFFELICEGKITVLCREKLEYRTVSSPYYYYGTTTRLVLVNTYFLLKPDGTISEFEGRKADWLRLMDDREREVKGFVKDNKLDFDQKYELARIIEYYNTLVK